MSARPEIAFYAPLKAPDHPVPSGDRAVARFWLKALEQAGFEARIESTLRSYEGNGDRALQNAIRESALAEAKSLVDYHLSRPMTDRPKLWFSYHVYYKAPDWIGPVVADALAIPYVIAEGSRAPKRADGPWAIGHEGAEHALDRADIILAMTRTDQETLLRFRPAQQRIIEFPPFLDLDDWPSREFFKQEAPPLAHFLTVAMMRHGDKLESYRQLAEALHMIAPPWQLDIVGDGPARSEIESLFSPLADSVTFHGQITDRSHLARFYREADLLLWPAVNEAYGMVFLEAQAFGCPVVAGDHGGVGAVINNDETGLLAAKNDPRAFAGAVMELMADSARRQHFSAHAHLFVANERSFKAAVPRLVSALNFTQKASCK